MALLLALQEERFLEQRLGALRVTHSLTYTLGTKDCLGLREREGWGIGTSSGVKLTGFCGSTLRNPRCWTTSQGSSVAQSYPLYLFLVEIPPLEGRRKGSVETPGLVKKSGFANIQERTHFPS